MSDWDLKHDPLDRLAAESLDAWERRLGAMKDLTAEQQQVRTRVLQRIKGMRIAGGAGAQPLSQLEIAMREARVLSPKEREQFALWVANGMPDL